MTPQPGILAALPAHARFVTFRLAPEADPTRALEALASKAWGEALVVGFGASVAARLGGSIEGLHDLAALSGPGVAVPATPSGLSCWLRGAAGEDPGVLLHRARELAAMLAPAFEVEDERVAFLYDEDRDLSGFVDGTENPVGERAAAVAFVAGRGPHLDGGSFLAIQRWRHDLDALARHSPREQDLIIGRTREGDEELDDAPTSAHVKRTAQEGFEPEAFLLRRSMPWSDGARHGLVFVAFGASLDPFERQLRRMAGLDDGVTDALFRFTRPETSASFFCPPLDPSGRLDLGALGIGPLETR